jgi:hypothetical protein
MTSGIKRLVTGDDGLCDRQPLRYSLKLFSLELTTSFLASAYDFKLRKFLEAKSARPDIVQLLFCIS